MSVELLRLEDLDAQIVAALNDDSTVIYWQHSFFKFDWLRANDQSNYQEALRNLQRGVRNDDIVCVKPGESLQVQDKKLYPMELEFQGRECYAYMMICRRGLMDDAVKTPYLFVSQTSRDKAVAYLNKTPKKEGRCTVTVVRLV